MATGLGGLNSWEWYFFLVRKLQECGAAIWQYTDAGAKSG